MTHEIRRNEERSRYELLIDGEIIGVADYRDNGGVIVLPHTEIKRERRGRGLGATLVRAALDDLRARKQLVDPRCWFVAEFIDANPGYRDLLAA